VTAGDVARGRLLVGTSGFAYPDWAPRFYPSGLKGDALLPYYASRLPAVELNNTFYARPTPAKVAAWVAATPPEFRFVVKAQRGAAMRALVATPEESVRWLTEDLGGFGERLGAVLFRVPHNIHRKPEAGSDDALRRLLAAWPTAIPFVAEFQHASWHVDETFAALREGGATLCATDPTEDAEAPAIRVTGPLIYVRLRRHDYGPDEIRAWAERVRPFLEAGHDAYIFFRHDQTGRGPELADELRAALAAP
jgi:uncharacterized protein YecE (DUF72 family)